MERQRTEAPGHHDGASAGRIPLAVAVVDGAGTVTHWSSGARTLFGVPRQEAVGAPAADLLPIGGALHPLGAPGGDAGPGRDPAAGRVGKGPGGLGGAPGSDLDSDLDTPVDGSAPYPSAGRARVHRAGGAAREVLWWAYPLFGPGQARLLVLAADAARCDARTLAEGPGAGEGDWPFDTQVAPGFALHTEFPGADRLARQLPEILPNTGPAAAERIVSQVLELGYPVLDLSVHRRVPVTPDWGVPRRPPRAGAAPPAAAVPAADPGELDLDNAAVRERLEFLNEVSRTIGATLDLERTIREVTEACVPRFADFSGIHLREQILAGEGFPDGPPDVTTVMHRVWVTHTDEPGRWDDTVPVGEAFAFPEHTPFHQCMSTGRPILIPRVDEALAARVAAQFEKRDLRPLINGRSMLVVPLLARRVVLGFMVLLRRPDRPPFDEVDRTTAAELAARAGLVLDNARLYTHQENAAETLQNSMLPQSLPRLAGVDTASRYLPGTRLGRVGGDWFDTIRLRGGRVGLVVGDVMGHGMHSAAIMGQLRIAVQTMAALDLPPARLLRNLDDVAQRLGEQYLATCLYAVYDPVACEIVLANAGHLPPVLVRTDGRAELLSLPTGVPIGVGGVPFEAVTVPVAPGDRLVLCTDGLVEVRGRDIGDGLAALCESAAHPAASMDDACDAIVRALNVGERKDDVALLMARLGGIPPEHVAAHRLDPDPGEVSRARRLTRDALLAWGLPDLVDTARLLVSELVTNALRYAPGSPVHLRLMKADRLLCEVGDAAHAVPALVDATADDEGGRGLRLVSHLAARWGTSLTDSGKTVWFELEPPAPPGAART
ncbi:SpoIIE family protein phosphatase [Streptomyces capparidis]